jgi:electron transfer flavoprotein beta subunit
LPLASAHGGRAIALGLIPQVPPRDVILKALAMGVAAVYLVTDAERLAHDPLRIATVLATAARHVAIKEGVARWDLVICGEASADEFNQQVGPRLAAELGLPSITYATSLALEGGLLQAQRAIEDRTEALEVDLPALVTVGNEINTARMPTVLQIMGAGRKPVTEMAMPELADLDIPRLSALPMVEGLDVYSPPSTRKQVAISGETIDDLAAGLLRRLGSDGEVTF